MLPCTQHTHTIQAVSKHAIRTATHTHIEREKCTINALSTYTCESKSVPIIARCISHRSSEGANLSTLKYGFNNLGFNIIFQIGSFVAFLA